MVEKKFLLGAGPEATAQVLAAYLKRHGPATVPQLRAALRLSENAVRHHLQALERHGLLTREGSTVPGRGRPATRYGLTARAEGLFPKRYLELLDAVLTVAQTEGLEERLLARVAADMAARVQPHLRGLHGPKRLDRLLQLLDYGDLLPELESVPAGVCLHAYNCVYVEAGRRHPAVCELLPGVITAATGLEATRLRCQRDGARACEFMVNTVG